jgi:hypothetical protein
MLDGKVALRSWPQLWRAQLPLRRWKGHRLSILKQHRLPIVGHRAMHDRTISVALYVCRETLLFLMAPAHSANLVALYAPPRKTFEMSTKPFSNVWLREVHKSIAQARMCFKIYR